MGGSKESLFSSTARKRDGKFKKGVGKKKQDQDLIPDKKTLMSTAIKIFYWPKFEDNM